MSKQLKTSLAWIALTAVILLITEWGLSRAIGIIAGLGLAGGILLFGRKPLGRADGGPESRLPDGPDSMQRSADTASPRARLIDRAVIERSGQGGADVAPELKQSDRAMLADLVTGINRDNAPPPPPESPIDLIIDAARRKPIVFRQEFSSDANPSLSFYGGRPVVPGGFTWPRASADPASKPLHFIMQWECCQLAEQDATGLLPKDGVLYFFLDFEWGRDDGFRFIHCPGAVEGWQPLDPPVDLGPVLGDQGAWQMAGCTSKVDDPNDYVPRLMPHAPFTPRSFDYPIPPADERDEGEADRLFWHDKSCAEALLTIEKSGRAPVALKDINEPKSPFERPFAAFPHDFGAIRVLAAEAIDELDGPYRVRKSRHVLTELSSEEREAKFDAWLREARELYIFASQRPMSGAVPQEVADQIWTWVRELEPVFRLGFYRVVTTAVDTSLGVGSEAIEAIPAEQIAEAATMHTLAREYLHDEYPASPKTDDLKLHEEKRARGELKKVRSVHAPTPTHMFGPPSYVQGYVEELMDDHLLLLEITSGSGPGHHFGDGVLQYLIRPDDLREGRFDRVKL
jgi:hypothetical protein